MVLHGTMPAKKSTNKGIQKENEYKMVIVKASLSPIVYKQFIEAMNEMGLDSEAQYLKYCIQLGNMQNKKPL